MASASEPFYAAEGLNVECYDDFTSVLKLDAVFGDDVAFYLDLARRLGGTVLDLGCGTGRVAWALARAGHPVVGVDRSRPMLARAEAKRSAQSPEVVSRVRFVRADMAAFELGQEVSLAITPYRSFQGLLTSEDQRRCVACVRRHLRPDGRFVVDVFDPRLDWCHPATGTPPTDVAGTEVALAGTTRRVRIGTHTRMNDPVAQVLSETFRFVEIDCEGRTVREESETLRMRWSYRYELRHLLALEGFEVEAEYSDFCGSPPAYGRELVLVACPV